MVTVRELVTWSQRSATASGQVAHLCSTPGGPWLQILRLREGRPPRWEGRSQAAGCRRQLMQAAGPPKWWLSVLIFEGMSAGAGDLDSTDRSY